MSLTQIFANYGPALLQGLFVTLKLAAITWASGLIIGGLLGLTRATKFIKIFSIILGSMPVLVFLFWMHYPLQEILGVIIDPFITAALALSIINIFLVADLVANELKEFPKQYEWAAKVCGLSKKQTVFKIKFPIIFRRILPSLILSQTLMLQATLFASLISVDEIFRTIQRINSIIYKPVELYSMLALFFILICAPLHVLALHLKNKYTKNLSES